MDDSDPEERYRGIANDTALIKAGFIHECRLYGARISAGMQAEKDLFEGLGIPVYNWTEEAIDARKTIKISDVYDKVRQYPKTPEDCIAPEEFNDIAFPK